MQVLLTFTCTGNFGSSQVSLCHIAVGNTLNMHWNLPTGSPERQAITSPTERLALCWVCEGGTWPPPVLTLECHSVCEYEIRPLKVEGLNLSPGLLKAACVNPSRASLKTICADLRVLVWWTRLWQAFCVKGKGQRGVMGPCWGRIERARWFDSALACGALGGRFYV